MDDFIRVVKKHYPGKKISKAYTWNTLRLDGNIAKLVTWDIDQIFTIDPNVNLYSEGHHWYDLARNFVKRPFPHYTDTIINASEVHLVNSSFRCLAAHLPLKASIKKCYARKTGKHIPEWTFNRYHPTSPS